MQYMLIPLVMLVLATALRAGLRNWRDEPRATAEPVADRGGWVYFITAQGQSGAPIKVGSTSRDPCKDRLPELRTMSPYPLRIIYKFQTEDRFRDEHHIHNLLAPHRRHGEWFDRDATLAYIDYLKVEEVDV